LHGREAALIFTSGYVANDAALSTLAHEMAGTVVFSDALNHASMIAGIRTAAPRSTSSAITTRTIWARLLERVPADWPQLVCFESVYSVDSDIARSANCAMLPTAMVR
jgi:5-aminolevulinate synthase